MSPKTLYLDIETSPHLGHLWGLFNQNVSLTQLRESSRVICWAAKWRGERRTYWRGEDNREDMLGGIYDLMSEADVVGTYNGDRFDIPTLHKEFLLQGWPPPAPYQSLDFYKVVKKRFRFASNKLDHITKELGLAGKVHHEGHMLWVKCLAGDPLAWKRMSKYNKQDVVLLEELHAKVEPWLQGGPNLRLYADPDSSGCPRCGDDIIRQGFSYTALGKYQRWRCLSGHWSQSSRREQGTEIRSI